MSSVVKSLPSSFSFSHNICRDSIKAVTPGNSQVEACSSDHIFPGSSCSVISIHRDPSAVTPGVSQVEACSSDHIFPVSASSNCNTASAIAPGNHRLDVQQAECNFSDSLHGTTNMCGTDSSSRPKPPVAALNTLSNMIRSSKRAQQYFDSDHLAKLADSCQSRKKSRKVCYPSNSSGPLPRQRKRKASTSLVKQMPARKKANYEWRGEKQLPRANGNLAAKFPSLFADRPPDHERA